MEGEAKNNIYFIFFKEGKRRKRLTTNIREVFSCCRNKNFYIERNEIKFHFLYECLYIFDVTRVIFIFYFLLFFIKFLFFLARL